VSANIVIVEDDPSILRGLQLNLELEGFSVRVATNGKTGLEMVRAGPVDLVVLDIMLPEMNGYEVCRRIRDDGNEVPIIVLSAKATEVDKVMGLDLGADDYVVKPFALAELIARINARLRRREPVSQIRFGDVAVDFQSAVVERAGKPIEMTARELQLLRFLVEREGQVLTREVILEHVWGQNYFGTDRTVDNFITRLRQKLDDEEPRHFLTVRGLGYRFRASA
jgi:two-component system, OmpR family, alkaline phosphatase synthesis response regulator PhoP